MTSFFQFYEHVQRSKLNESVDILLEMPMRPEDDPDQYANRHVSPYAPTTAKDGYVGRTSKRIVDKGADIDKELAAQNWDQAVQDRPELGFYSQANQEMKKDKAATRAATQAAGLDTVSGARNKAGRMIQTNKTDGEEDVESIAAKNRGIRHLLGKIEELKGQIKELRPQVQDYFDPRMMKLVRELYGATTQFMKDGRLGGPEAQKIMDLHHKMAELIQKSTEASSWEDL